MKQNTLTSIVGGWKNLTTLGSNCPVACKTGAGQDNTTLVTACCCCSWRGHEGRPSMEESKGRGGGEERVAQERKKDRDNTGDRKQDDREKER